MGALDNFRAKYPGYDDMSDVELATKLATKYPDAYGDLLQQVSPGQIDVGSGDSTVADVGIAPVDQPNLATRMGEGFQDFTQNVRSARMGFPTTSTMANITGKGLNIITDPLVAADVGLAAGTGAGAEIAAGLTGLGTLAYTGGDLQQAARNVEGVQSALTYQPQSEASQDVMGAMAAPFTGLSKVAAGVADPIAEAGFPNIAAGVATGIEAAPMLVGAKKITPKRASTTLKELAADTKKTVVKTVDSVLKPAYKDKKTATAVKAYNEKAVEAVESMVKRKNQLGLTDEAGSPVARTPENLEDLQVAASGAKKGIFNEFDRLVQKTDDPIYKDVRPLDYPRMPGEEIVYNKDGKATGFGVREDFSISGQESVLELAEVIESKPLRVNSPETIRYAEDRIKQYASETFTAAEAQENIQLLNKSVDSFYNNNPTLEAYGRARVDATIVNALRKQLDAVVKKATGGDYQALKNEYGAIKALEEDIGKAANKARNAAANMKLPSFTDIMSGHQVVEGIINFNTGRLAGGLTMKALSMLKSAMKDPNRQIKKMFDTVDKNITKTQQIEGGN